MSKYQNRMDAILLIGPTGSGKTPFGWLLEKRGFRGRRCVHFDFGSSLRSADASCILTPDEKRVARRSVATGSLLEDMDFGIALNLLNAFLEERSADKDTLVILNGLPRHTSQAQALEPYIDVRFIINLECSPEVATERIRLNAGTDRAGRTYDTPQEVTKRFTTYRARTEPLLDYYQRLGVPVLNVATGVTTSAEDILDRLINLKIAGGISQVDL